MSKIINTGTTQLLATEEDNVLTLTLNNPKFKNALSEELTPYLRKILKKISKYSKYKLLIIRGAGDSFCSGGNIKKMNNSPIDKKNLSNSKKVENLFTKQIELTYMISSLNIPTIAAITGPAAGAGFSLALSCDIRIGNRNAFFLSNYSKIGLSGDYGISWYLTKLLGAHKAKEVMFINDRIYSKEALSLGLLNLLCNNRDLENTLDSLKNRILSQSTYALKLIKMNINYAIENNLKNSLKLEAKNMIKSSTSTEHKIAVKNFKKKQ